MLELQHNIIITRRINDVMDPNTIGNIVTTIAALSSGLFFAQSKVTGYFGEKVNRILVLLC
ncbi:MAG: hypothetical protein ACI9XK_000618 [Granulosicoccus sp.]|jgi:hypothetical protein